MKLVLNGVQVAPFGLKLCQNDAPDLRIIFLTLLGQKSKCKNQKHLKIAPGGRRQGAKPLRSAAVRTCVRALAGVSGRVFHTRLL